MRLKHDSGISTIRQTESESETDRDHSVFTTLQFNQPLESVPEDWMQCLNDTYYTHIETESKPKKKPIPMQIMRGMLICIYLMFSKLIRCETCSAAIVYYLKIGKMLLLYIWMIWFQYCLTETSCKNFLLKKIELTLRCMSLCSSVKNMSKQQLYFGYNQSVLVHF